VRRLLALILVPLVLLAGCSTPSPDATGPLAGVTVTGDVGSAPLLDGVEGLTTDAVVTRVITEGTGDTVADADTIDVHYLLVKAADATELGTTFGDSPAPLVVDAASDPLLSANLVGRHVGSRVLLAAPASEIYGEGVGDLGLVAADTLVVVVDVMSKFVAPEVTGTIDDVTVTGAFGEAPTITPKANLVVGETQVRVLSEGTGDAVTAGDSVTINYTGVNGRTGEVFDSSFQTGQTADFVIDATNVIQGFVTGLTGQRVGSRLLLAIPYADGYGTTGAPDAGIEGGDTLVFVVDLIAKAA